MSAGEQGVADPPEGEAPPQDDPQPDPTQGGGDETPPEPDPVPDESWTVAQIEDYASERGIDISAAKKKGDKLALVLAGEPATTVVKLERGGETTQVVKPSADYTRLVRGYGWKEA